MIRSMTGYGKGEIEEKGVRIAAEVTSVNNRFLEISAKLPKFLIPLEGDVKKVVQSRVSRGRVFVTITWDESEGVAETLSLDEEVADRYYNLFRSLKERYDLPGDVTVSMFAGLADIMKREVAEWEPAKAFPLVEEALKIALDDLVEMKTREGQAIARDLQSRIENTLSHLEEIERRVPRRTEELRKRLKARLGDVLEPGDYNEALLAQEVVLFAERSDCTEECVRYRVHSKNFIDYLREGGPVGRKLGFLLQEITREANTMGSKAGDAHISENVVAIKEEAEKIREQIQNIE